MKYGLSELSYEPESFIEITQAEFEGLTAAKAGIIAVVVIEEKFDLLIEHHAELELEMLSLGLREALFHEYQYSEMRDRERVLTRRFANLLSSARLYVDQINHDLSALYGRNSDIRDKIRKKRDAEV